MNEKKKANITIPKGTIFFLIAYGVNYLFGIPLMIHQYIDPEVFGGLMVLLPAAGVFIIKLLYEKNNNENNIIRNVMLGLCLFYFLMIFLKLMGVFGDKVIYWATETATIIGSLIIMISVWLEKGIFEHYKSVQKAIFLFLLLLGVRNIAGAVPVSGSAVVNTIFSMSLIPFMFLLNAVRYFGEEFGWRGYLQEKMQNKFGKRLGVILLGVIWELWHMPLWFTLYELKLWENLFRFAIAISLSIFLGYIYMRTKNVWLCSLVHCAYNMMTVTAMKGVQVKSQVAEISMLVISIIVMSLFLFTKEYSTNKMRCQQ